LPIDVENVVELRSGHDPLELVPREIPPTDWQRYEANVAEIFEAFGLPPDPFWRGAFRDAELRREFLDEVRARSPR
jgi:hypothetical protein